MDYIPSNKHGDYIAHSEEYLMHYGVKGMKWKDHDYVEDVKTGAREVVGDVKSKIKQLKKFVSKKFGNKSAKPKYEYKEETDSERKARKWKTWQKIKADESRDAAINNSTRKGMQAVANKKVENRNARIKDNQVKSAAANDSNNVSVQQRNREKAQSYGQNRSSQVATNNKDRRINAPSTTVNRGTQSRDDDIKRGTQNSMNVTRDSKTRTSAKADANINRLASQATPKRPDPNPIAYTPNEIDAKLKVKDDYDLKKYLHSKKNKTNR